MYEHPALSQYSHYMRVDADLLLQAPITDAAQDPLCYAQQNGLSFMYPVSAEIAWQSCSAGLWEWFQHAAKMQQLQPADAKSWNEQAALTDYVGFLGVGSLDVFRSPAALELARRFNADGRVCVGASRGPLHAGIVDLFFCILMCAQYILMLVLLAF